MNPQEHFLRFPGKLTFGLNLKFGLAEGLWRGLNCKVSAIGRSRHLEAISHLFHFFSKTIKFIATEKTLKNFSSNSAMADINFNWQHVPSIYDVQFGPQPHFPRNI